MEAFLGIGGVVAVLGLFAALSAVNRRQTRRIIRNAETRRFDTGLVGDVLPADDRAMVPYRVPTAQATGYASVEHSTPRGAATLETAVMVPALLAFGTAVVATIGTGALALWFGWPAKLLPVVFGLALMGGWLWRVGIADRLLWSVERWIKSDLDGDGQTGRPVTVYPVADPGQARSAVARAERLTAEDARRAALMAFADRCYLAGTPETAHGIAASGPDRDNYIACRDTFIKLGLARWKNPQRPKGGWVMTTDPAMAKAIVEQHAL